MENSEQVRRNERYLRQTEARDYEEFAGLYDEEEPDFEYLAEKERRAFRHRPKHYVRSISC